MRLQETSQRNALIRNQDFERYFNLFFVHAQLSGSKANPLGRFGFLVIGFFKCAILSY
jgi:hypothetical protein